MGTIDGSWAFKQIESEWSTKAKIGTQRSLDFIDSTEKPFRPIGPLCPIRPILLFVLSVLFRFIIKKAPPDLTRDHRVLSKVPKSALSDLASRFDRSNGRSRALDG